MAATPLAKTLTLSTLSLLLMPAALGLSWSFDPAPASDGTGLFSFLGATYDMTVHWGDDLDLPSGTLWTANIVAGTRTATAAQTLDIGSYAQPLTASPQFLVGHSDGIEGGIPWLRLEFAFAPTTELPAYTEGFVTLRFHPDHVLHHYSFRLPNGGFVPAQFAQTVVTWDTAATGHGSILADGTVIADDDGSALDPNGKWEAFGRYAVYQASDLMFSHARVAQGPQVNYLGDGTFRVDDQASEVRTVFNGFLDVGVLGNEWWALDAFLFQATADPLDARATYNAIATPGGVQLPPVGDPTAHPVVVAIPDSGINPYHAIYHRPTLTMHPCTYIQDFPCDIPALPLSIGVHDNYDDAYAADQHLWDQVDPGEWYWIPKTVFVAVHCESINSGSHCILDGDGHGTGTTSSVLTENMNALIAFKEGASSITPFVDRGLPIDVYSVSWGNIAPIPGHPDVLCLNHQVAPIYVTSSGNDPRSTLIDCRKGDPRLISVGGASAADNTEEVLSAKQPEVVSYYCRPTAAIDTLDGWVESYCGTSFAGPTVAGALSKVIQEVRAASGYTGSLTNGYIDPIAGITIQDLRDAMNRTATYSPQPEYGNPTVAGVPTNSAQPWLQWSWGFYDGTVADATIQHLLGIQTAPEKPLEARAYMESVHLAKTAIYGPLP